MSETAIHSLEQEQAQLVESYLQARLEAGADPKRKRALGGMERKLDELYWRRVTDCVTARVSAEGDALSFTDPDRLLLDVGLLDPALVKGAGPDLTDRLLTEIRAPGPDRHVYLSEWLEERFRRYIVNEQVTEAAEKRKRERAGGDPLKEARTRLAQRLEPLFDSLPGVPGEVARQVLHGGVDDQILQNGLHLLHQPGRRLFRYRSRLRTLRGQVLEKARARAADHNTLRLFDMLDEIYAREWREAYARQSAASDNGEEAAEQAEANLPREKAVQYLTSELHFVKSLMPLGALSGGVARTCAVLLEDGARVTRDGTGEGIALVQHCDRDFTVTPLVLIAPFRGRGIFEWDRDSLVIGLHPVDDAESSVAHAAANYRMLNDNFQGERALREAYESAFPDKKFQQAFPADYRTWITRAGHGSLEGIDAPLLRFFLDHIGPDLSAPLCPANLRNLSPQTRKAFVNRLRSQARHHPDDANLHHRLAILYWQEGKTAEALGAMARAAKLGPKNGMVLLGLGLLLRAEGQMEKARGVLKACQERVPHTLWSLYARLLLAGKV